MGDLSRNHATIARDGDGYVLRAHEATFVNNRKVETAPLHDGDVIRLGQTVELEFRQPSPVSSSARLAVVSRHRLPLAVDGILLMAETCIIGNTPQSHITASGLSEPVVLYRQGNALWCRAANGFEVDLAAPCAASVGALTPIECARRRILVQFGSAERKDCLNSRFLARRSLGGVCSW